MLVSRRPGGRAGTTGWALGLALLVVACVLAATPTPAWAKSYGVTNVSLDAEILPDGSLKVAEERTFSFSGSYSLVEQDLLLGGTQGISGITVSESGTPYRLAAGGPGTYSYREYADRVTVTWRFSAMDEDRSFVLSYVANGAVRAHLDVAELYWKFIGDDWEIPQQNILVSLKLPAGAQPGQVRAWGHGPLAGEVDIESPTEVVWRLARLPRGEFLEGRVVFPTDLVPQATRTSGRTVLQEILDEEARWAAAANRSRWLAVGSIVLGVLFLLGAIALAIILQARHGREFRPEFEGDYYRELPAEYSPAELGCLWRFGPVGSGEITATILDLARRGYLQIEAKSEEVRGFLGARERTEYLLRRAERGARPLSAEYDPGKLRRHESRLLEFLFDQVGSGAEVFSFDAIKDYAKSNPAAMQAWIHEFEGAVRATDAAEGFFDRHTEQVRMWEIVGGVFAALAGAGLVVLSLPAAGIPVLLGGGILLAAASGLRRRSRLGSTHLAMWRAFRRFLLHFSSLDRAEVPSLTVWEHYLVYAVVLGVAKEVLEQLKVVYPQLAETRPGVHPWVWLYVAGGRFAPAAMVGNLTDALQSSVATAANFRPSSRGGFGGGFSGGGGFGGGGGGGRAR